MYNEESGIKDFITTIKKTFQKFDKPWELILVDDGSSDHSFDIATQFTQNDDNISVLSLGRHYGRGKGLREGIKYSQGSYIVTIESDCSWNIKDIFKIIEVLEKEKADAVLVSPYTKGGKVKGVPFLRVLISWLGNKILGLSFKGSFSMVTQMFRGYRAEVIKSLELSSDDKEFHLEVVSKLVSLGYDVREIPGILSKRGEGKSKFRLKHTAFTHLIFSILERPLFFFGIIGMLFFIAGIVLGGYLIYLWLTQSLNPDRPLMTLLVLLLLAGTQMFSFGLMGILIMNLRKELLRIQTKLNSE